MVPTRRPRKRYRHTGAPTFDPNKSVPENVLSTLEAMVALADHYGIETGPERWFILAWRLATDYVPGFARRRPQGRKPQPNQAAFDVMLVIELFKAEQAGKSVKNAARLLAKKPGTFQGKNPNTLRDRYYLLKDSNSVEGKRARELVAALLKPAKVAG